MTQLWNWRIVFFHIELGIKLIIIDIWTNKLLKSENLQKSQNAARCCISIHEGVENPFEFLITENVLQGIGWLIHSAISCSCTTYLFHHFCVSTMEQKKMLLGTDSNNIIKTTIAVKPRPYEMDQYLCKWGVKAWFLSPLYYELANQTRALLLKWYHIQFHYGFGKTYSSILFKGQFNHVFFSASS